MVDFCLFFFLVSDSSCSIKINSDIPHREPVYVLQKPNGKQELLEPTSGRLEIASDEQLLLFCSGSRNKLINSGSNSEVIGCDSKFRRTLQTTNCTKPVSPTLHNTEASCTLNNRHGLVYRVGFEVGEDFLQVYELCYDYESASALYAHHRLNGKAIDGEDQFFSSQD